MMEKTYDNIWHTYDKLPHFCHFGHWFFCCGISCPSSTSTLPGIRPLPFGSIECDFQWLFDSCRSPAEKSIANREGKNQRIRTPDCVVVLPVSTEREASFKFTSWICRSISQGRQLGIGEYGNHWNQWHHVNGVMNIKISLKKSVTQDVDLGCHESSVRNP